MDASGPLMRALLCVIVLAALLASWYAARWYAGSEIALAATQLPENAMEAAESARRLAPSDPMAHRSVAYLQQRRLEPGALEASLREFEKAVSLSPHDFRLWVDLGQARERVDDVTGAEQAQRRAVELAPFYSWPRWHLGNFLVRRGRYDEGLLELRRVAETDPYKRGAIFDLAWAVYGGDVNAINGALGHSPAVRMELAAYLLKRGLLDESLQIWSSLKPAEKREDATTGKLLVDALVSAKRYRAALGILRDVEGESKAEVGRLSNHSFESPISQGNVGIFDWHVPNVPQASVALESGNARDGNLSLRVLFNAPGALNFEVWQLVAVEPATSYRLIYYAKANNLKSAATTLIQVLGSDDKVLAASEPLAAGKSDWQQFSLDFKTPSNVEGITVRIMRAPCQAEGAVCPIFGTVWYDNFNLQSAGR
jgi:tetratricopeptide (TPR) repeat protein